MLLDENKLNDLFNLEEKKETINNTVNTDSVKAVYDELKKLIENGNSILETVKYVVQSNADPELVSSMASLISSITDTLREFTKLHLQNIKHEQQKELELIKIKAKKEMLQLKIDETKKLLQNKNGEENNTNLIAYTQEHVINTLNKYKTNEVINVTPIVK